MITYLSKQRRDEYVEYHWKGGASPDFRTGGPPSEVFENCAPYDCQREHVYHRMCTKLCHWIYWSKIEGFRRFHRSKLWGVLKEKDKCKGEYESPPNVSEEGAAGSDRNGHRGPLPNPKNGPVLYWLL